MTTLAASTVAAHYDRLAPAYDGTYAHAVDLVENEVLADALARFVEPPAMSSIGLVHGALNVLDLCAGTGLAYDLLDGAVCHYWAVDASAGMLDQLRRKHDRGDDTVHPIEGDSNAPSTWAHEVRWKPDLITCLFAAEYLNLPGLLAPLAARWPGTPVFLHGLAHDRPWSRNPAERTAELEDGWPARALATARSLGVRAPVGFNAVPDALAQLCPRPLLAAAVRRSLHRPWREHHHYALVGVL